MIFGDGRKEKRPATRILSSSRPWPRPSLRAKEHPFSAAQGFVPNGGERMAVNKDLSIQQHRFEGRLRYRTRPPTPTIHLVAYRGPSVARADAAGLLKSGPSS